METRTLGKTGLKVSVLGFGCGAVGGLMVRGEPSDQERAVARALELGINYFDTAPVYGNGESEKNLGKLLAALRPDVFVGTKVHVPQAEFGRIAEAATASLEASLRRLGREQVDLLQLHNNISHDSKGDVIAARSVLEEVVPALQLLQQQGKIRFYGITAMAIAMRSIGSLIPAQLPRLKSSTTFSIPAPARLSPRASRPTTSETYWGEREKRTSA
jgi:aryl-alcohol dehydrogenase-like predicted oxidoreductase